MTASTRVRKCAGCGYPFRGNRDELYCSAACAGQPTTMALIDLLRRFPIRKTT